MTHHPLVSIMMPCYNANATLPRALASVLAQTCDDWECIVVDDGSVVSPAPIVRAASDPRIKLVTLPANRGRAVARQVALNHASGEFLAMLDADDWMYPARLADQLQILANDPALALVSSAVAIVNRENDIIGVRGGTADRLPYRCEEHGRFGWPPFAHASSMIKMNFAKSYHYEPRFVTSEDTDFVLKIISEHPFALLREVHYAYAEETTLTLAKVLSSHRNAREILQQYVSRHPIAVRRLVAQSLAKSFAYRVAFRLGVSGRLVAQRSRQPTSGQCAHFYTARDQVRSFQRLVFGNVSAGVRSLK